MKKFIKYSLLGLVGLIFTSCTNTVYEDTDMLNYIADKYKDKLSNLEYIHVLDGDNRRNAKYIEIKDSVLGKINIDEHYWLYHPVKRLQWMHCTKSSLTVNNYGKFKIQFNREAVKIHGKEKVVKRALACIDNYLSAVQRVQVNAIEADEEKKSKMENLYKKFDPKKMEQSQNY